MALTNEMRLLCNATNADGPMLVPGGSVGFGKHCAAVDGNLDADTIWVEIVLGVPVMIALDRILLTPMDGMTSIEELGGDPGSRLMMNGVGILVIGIIGGIGIIGDGAQLDVSSFTGSIVMVRWS